MHEGNLYANALNVYASPQIYARDLKWERQYGFREDRKLGERTLQERERLSEKFVRLVRLQSHPVAVKMLKSVSEVEGMGIKKPDRKLAVCQLISQAYFVGHRRIGTVQELGDVCPLGAGSLGLMQVPQAYVQGLAYLGSYHATKEVGKSVIESIPKFDPGEYAGILVSPLDKSPVDPDVVIFGGNVSQILVFVRSYLHNRGGRLDSGTCAMAGCADLIVRTMCMKIPSVVLPCLGYRLLAFPSETDLLCGVPGELLEEILAGIEFNYKAGVVYPTAWQHIVRNMPLIWPYPKYIEDQFEKEAH